MSFEFEGSSPGRFPCERLRKKVARRVAEVLGGPNTWSPPVRLAIRTYLTNLGNGVKTERTDPIPGVDSKISKQIWYLFYEGIGPLVQEHLDQCYPPRMNHREHRQAERLATVNEILRELKMDVSSVSGH